MYHFINNEYCSIYGNGEPRGLTKNLIASKLMESIH